jgi:hypothetical protein
MSVRRSSYAPKRMNRLRERRFLSGACCEACDRRLELSDLRANSARAFLASSEFERSKEAILSSISSATAAVAIVIWLAFATTALAMRLIFFPLAPAMSTSTKRRCAALSGRGVSGRWSNGGGVRGAPAGRCMKASWPRTVGTGLGDFFLGGFLAMSHQSQLNAPRARQLGFRPICARAVRRRAAPCPDRDRRSAPTARSKRQREGQ